MRRTALPPRPHVLAAAAFACLALHATASHALALGQLRVLSALGEPLLAEIDVPQIAPAELADLQAGVASPADFAAAGLAYNPSLQGVVPTLQRRADGSMVLRLAGTQPVNDPAIDLMLQARGGGRSLWRDYTLRVDPPRPRENAAGGPAIALGQARVLSARGEPLRAEVELPLFTPERAPGLRATLSSPADFQATGLAYSPALRGAQLSLGRRADGRPYLGIAGAEPVTEASIDLMLEASWPAGRIVRDYSLPVGGPAPAVAAAPPPPPAPASASAPAPASAPARQVKARGGDTATRIALAHKPAEVSLEQMLVALLRANPQAFVDGNVNRLKAGAVLRLPEPAQVAGVPQEEAGEVLSLHSRNFDEFRRKLALQMQAQPLPPARLATGKLEALVTEKKPAPPPDRLTLASPAVGSSLKAEERIAAQLVQQERRAATLAGELKAVARQAASGAANAASAPGARN